MFDQSTRDLPEYASQTLFQQMHESSWFVQILARVKTLQSLQALFDQECPLELMNRCRILGIKEHCLTIEVDNASWATQLRYRTRELLMALRKYPDFIGLKKIHIRISRVPLPANSPKISLLAEPLSPEAIKILRQVGDEVADPVLKQALLHFVGG